MTETRDKELRLALVCYGGISLAVYMHGITKEVWRLARASCAERDGADGRPDVYRELIEEIRETSGVNLRVLVDILAGASAGGINTVFLAQAIATGQSLDPLTDLWMDNADVEALLEPRQRPRIASPRSGRCRSPGWSPIAPRPWTRRWRWRRATKCG